MKANVVLQHFLSSTVHLFHFDEFCVLRGRLVEIIVLAAQEVNQLPSTNDETFSSNLFSFHAPSLLNDDSSDHN